MLSNSLIFRCLIPHQESSIFTLYIFLRFHSLEIFSKEVGVFQGHIRILYFLGLSKNRYHLWTQKQCKINVLALPLFCVNFFTIIINPKIWRIKTTFLLIRFNFGFRFISILISISFGFRFESDSIHGESHHEAFVSQKYHVIFALFWVFRARNIKFGIPIACQRISLLYGQILHPEKETHDFSDSPLPEL